ncbi:hypothetical protein COK00_21445 [Bacillus cereus]|uniref:Uncharacterized protein n=1 Tax=Bacillus cereus TaxID=1396 RepID=A0A2B2T1N4_BACCE|nr:hypothetical protein CON28_00470 [Bacillus cereus]PEQ53192.1 hypothetical protein CN468_02130 [Bacillus cereus]PEX38565.1 hypothetical protein CN455_12495 [Bacillus cereus]PFB16503.1 hypothetical protein CN399_10700 [Bacillus cereus]PFC72732.1 hypothetical protein CN290_18250 [Bacillus cereus]
MNIKSFFTMYNYFTASLNSFSALNAGALESAIHISVTLLYKVLTYYVLNFILRSPLLLESTILQYP